MAGIIRRASRAPRHSARGGIIGLLGVCALLIGLLAACGPRDDIPVTLTISVAGQNPEVEFQGTEGDRIYFDVTGYTANVNSDLIVYSPSDQQVAAIYSVGDFETGALPEDGTYRLVLDGYASTTGSVSVTIRDANPFTQGSTTVGGQIDMSIAKPGYNPGWTFNAAEGDRVYFDVTGYTANINSDLILYAPSGQQVAANYSIGDFETGTLSTTGKYRLVLDGYAATTGSVSVTIRDANPFSQGSTNVGGLATPSITDPGLNPGWTFTASQGDRIYFDVTGYTADVNSDLILYSPSGQQVAASYSIADFETTLPTNGTYRLVLDGYQATTGTATVRVRSANPFTQGSTSIGGQASFSITDPGRNPGWTFAAAQGNKLQFSVIGSTVNVNSDLILYSPSGQQVAASYSVAGFQTGALSATGTYRLVLDGYQDTTGTATIGIAYAP